MATIKDVAADAGVSAATVSRVLNGREVSPELADRVRSSVDALGYRPSRIARSLRTRSTRVWGLIISDIRNPFFTEMARGVEDVAAKAGYSVVLCNADQDPVKEAKYVDLVYDEQMAGCIIVPADTERSRIDALVAAGTPVIAVDREIQGVDLDLVRIDNREAAAHATRHLLQQGFTDVACITGPATTSTGRDRALGYIDEVGEDRSRLIWGDFKYEGGYEGMQALLRLPDPPDAVVVGNNMMMIGVLNAIRDAGRSPEEFGLIGFDLLVWADLTHPPLSTIGQPTYEIGRIAAELLVERIDGETRPPHEVILPSRLQVRDSSRRVSA